MKSVFTKKKKLEIPLPGGWHEVPFNVGLQIFTDPSLTEIDYLSLVSGVDKKDLLEQTDLETISYLTNSLLFLTNWPVKKYAEFPKSINYTTQNKKFKKNIVLPFVNYSDKYDLGKASVGQVEDMKYLLTSIEIKEDKDAWEHFPKFVAIYLHPIVNGTKYDHEAAMHLSNHIAETLDFKTVMNMGYFFFEKLNGLMIGQKNEWRKVPTIKRKLKRAFMNLVQRLVSMLP